MSSAQTSFDRAEQACLIFLGGVLGMEAGEGKDLSRDDWQSPDLVNHAVFFLSGGPEQVQNYCGCVPGAAWFAYAQLLAQYETRAAAIAALGMIQNKFSPRRTGGTPGLNPNVRNFDIMEHPEIVSQIILDENNTVEGRVFILRARFRVVYDNTTT